MTVEFTDEFGPYKGLRRLGVPGNPSFERVLVESSYAESQPH